MHLFLWLYFVLFYFIWFIFYFILISFTFCHLFLVFKFKFPFGGSKPVCICPLHDNTDVKMTEMCRHCHTYQREHRLDQIHYVCCYLLLFVSNAQILSNKSSPPKLLCKKGTPKILWNPQENTCARVSLSTKKRVTYIKNDRTATWIGRKNNDISNYVDLCCIHILCLLFSLYLYKILISGLFHGLF